MYIECLEIMKKSDYHNKLVIVAQTMNNLGNILKDLNQFEDSELIQSQCL
jgi:hypothetical protein